MASSASPTLDRAIGRWAFVALGVNSMIGSGIFGLPSIVAGKLGPWAPVAWLVAAAAIGLVVACFVEVGSRFESAGGPYLFARTAFGGFVGIAIGWLSYLVRLTATAANANLLIVYLGGLIPALEQPVWAGLATAVVIGSLAWLNYRGIKQGSSASTAAAVAKLATLGLFALGGLALVATRGAVPSGPTPPADVGTWVEVLLVLVYAYAGFENVLLPLAEVANPRRNVPFVAAVVFPIVVVLCTLVQMVVSWSLPNAGSFSRPLAESARVLVGEPGAMVMTLGVMLSLFGFLAAMMLAIPRLTFAMAERGDLPAVFARIHPVYRTPSWAIVVFAGLVIALAVSGTFRQNLTLSAVLRMFIYGPMFLALPILRRREGEPGIGPTGFRLPAGNLVAVVGLGLAIVLAAQMTWREVWALLAIGAVSLMTWWLTRERRAGS